MGRIITWLADNWFTLIQSLGVIGGLSFTGLMVRRDGKARKITDLLTLNQQHRELWAEVRQQPELVRIARESVDFVTAPVSEAEEEFLNLVIVHFYTSWLIVNAGSLVDKAAFAGDLRSFFKLPIPSAVWERTKTARDPKFVEFVQNVLNEMTPDDAELSDKANEELV